MVPSSKEAKEANRGKKDEVRNLSLFLTFHFLFHQKSSMPPVSVFEAVLAPGSEAGATSQD